jgi:prevent-host-death family protein
MNVSVRQLKNGLSSYLRRVTRGERLVVTDRGRPIAELAPISDERLSPEQLLEKLVERGDVAPPSTDGFATVEPIRRRGRPIAETLIEDRR